jgi:hypothetical protein
MQITSQHHWYVSRYCGRKFSEKSAAYVATPREVSQQIFIADFICKALLAGKINHSSKRAF